MGYTKCIAALCHHLIYLSVHESWAPVTWSSVVAILVVSVVSSNFFRWSFRELVLLPEANTPRPGLWYKCSLCKSFYAFMHSTCKLTTIGLIYRWGCTSDQSFKMFELVPEATWNCHRLYCTCIILHCWEFSKHIWNRKGLLLFEDQNDKRKYGDSRLNKVKDSLALMSISWKTKDILSRFKDHFWSVMLMMFHLNVF